MKVKVSDVDAPLGICFKQRIQAPHSMERCPLPKGHNGRCLPDLVAELEEARALVRECAGWIVPDSTAGRPLLSRLRAWLERGTTR
jgi:hypothetical protein